MSKLSFRARALDASKPMPIFMAEELPDLPDYSAINRAVPQMPSGMEKEEECEHHLQRAICAGLIIPTPEVSDMPEAEIHDKLYPANYKCPRQLIHMQPFTMEQDIPDYDMDSEDERWLESQAKRLDLSPLKFEEMMDRLEKSSGQTVVTLNEAKALLKEDDDLIIAVFDYWLNKRLKLQHPLILSVRTEQRVGTAVNNPYLAFRRRTEKMQTRKNRKNDETSYEKMLKLRRDLSRAVTLLEFVKRREKIKREYVHLTVEIFEKRYQAKDFNGSIISELSALKTTRHAFTPIIHNHYSNQSWSNKAIIKDGLIPRKEKRPYKKRKHKSMSHSRMGLGSAGMDSLGPMSSDEEPMMQDSPEPEEVEDEGMFTFRRNKLCSYHMPASKLGNWPWCSKDDNGSADKRYRFTLTSLSKPRKCIGFARRRIGRGGRVILDRVTTDFDDYWRTLDYTIFDSTAATVKSEVRDNCDNSESSEAKPDVRLGDVKVEGEVKSEVRTSEGSDLTCVIKTEPAEAVVPETVTNGGGAPSENVDEMLEILRDVQRDWLHFRPKTPPQDYEPPCHLLPPEDSTFLPSSESPFTLELRPLDGTGTGTFLDSSSFLSSPFLLDSDQMLCSGEVFEKVPVTDTRQAQLNLNLNVGLNTLNVDSLDDGPLVGCSRFLVSDVSCNGEKPSARVAPPETHTVRVKGCAHLLEVKRKTEAPLVNGVVNSYGVEVPASQNKTKNHKLHPQYAYSGRMGISGHQINNLSLHTSAHTVTLNSHSANILQIPLSDGDPVGKVKDSGAPPASTKNNKAMVRKPNLVMEVT